MAPATQKSAHGSLKAQQRWPDWKVYRRATSPSIEKWNTTNHCSYLSSFYGCETCTLLADRKRSRRSSTNARESSTVFPTRRTKPVTMYGARTKDLWASKHLTVLGTINRRKMLLFVHVTLYNNLSKIIHGIVEGGRKQRRRRRRWSGNINGWMDMTEPESPEI